MPVDIPSVSLDKGDRLEISPKGGEIMTEPKSSLVDVMNYLKSDEDGIPGTPTPTSEVKLLTPADRLELRISLDKVRLARTLRGT